MRRLPWVGRKVSVIWNGYAIPTDHGRLRSDLCDSLHLLVVARLSPEKNGFRLLEAMKLLQERGQATPQLSWAGRIPSERRARRVYDEMLSFLEQNPAIKARVQWLGEVKDVQALYASSDLLVLPSLYEGLPNVICEAMLAGCPVLASNVCDHPRLLGDHGERGLLCDPYSPASIASAIQQFQSMSTTERAGVARRAREFAQTNLGIEQMLDSYEQLLRGHAVRGTR
jgi:glycosyltransferase involved in cell wall biosynthesis